MVLVNHFERGVYEVKITGPMSVSFQDRFSRQINGRKTDGAAEACRTAKAVVRASKVARGKELVRDPDYPSDEVLTAIGRHFARHWIT